MSKERLESSTERNSSLNQVLPNANEWSDFLPNRKNKLQRCNLLTDYFTSGEIATEKVVFVTKEKICYIKRADQIRQVFSLLYSEHKEEDHRIANHAKYVSDNDNNENSSITIVTDDTDIYILLIRISCYCRSILYFRQGTSSSKAGVTYHNVSAAASEFGESICKILPSFHALTGSDFSKTFYRRSKIQSFKKMLTQPSAINLLFFLATVRVDVAQIIDFVLHMVYNRPEREKAPGESRYTMLFVKKGKKKVLVQTKQLPPYERSLLMKILRANYISYCWENCLNQHFEIPNPLVYGWKICDGKLEPSWFEGPALPSFEQITQEQNNLDSLSDLNQDRDPSTPVLG